MGLTDEKVYSMSDGNRKHIRERCERKKLHTLEPGSKGKVMEDTTPQLANVQNNRNKGMLDDGPTQPKDSKWVEVKNDDCAIRDANVWHTTRGRKKGEEGWDTYSPMICRRCGFREAWVEGTSGSADLRQSRYRTEDAGSRWSGRWRRKNW